MAKWIEWLLSLEESEKHIDIWKTQLQHTNPVSEIQQSLAWQTLLWADRTTHQENFLKLVFSLFIDWFNPRGNKISGKQESLGCLVVTCLNLPPVLRNKPAFTLLYTIIPGPNLPNVITISNILKPFVDELLILKDGIMVSTHKNPQGQIVYAQLLPLIGDLVAIHKVVGFGSHSANQFCSWCKSELTDLQSLKMGEQRVGVEVLKVAQALKDAKNLSAQEQICRMSGVQWSELNRINYQVPNMHISLGVMHNWLEGVLAEHFHHRWGFQEDSQEKQKASRRASPKSKRIRLGSENLTLDQDEVVDSDTSLSQMIMILSWGKE
ncbi:hypothetical protein O181_100221 [Austropuccinia psidii MF-1]|uniref:Uncharacterized protein n=1 Tax=Austropuccinia psidii MF-1 TaxID=1389203 RepID=A0A9Q3JEZ7_9BASI|nr:hypothetical protein [Austropuccinia psidii MF-1]